jgi:serine-type D-Ala-D-Ala carboxypeptidase
MKNEKISEFLQSRIDAGDFPSAVYLVAEKGEIRFHDALGLAVVEPERIEAREDTIYDLASLTKPLVTGLLCAMLIERGAINLTDKISTYFAAYRTDEKGEISLADLLTHRSGFRNWEPFYLLANSESEILTTIAKEPLANPLGSTVVYSDLNFILLRFLIEKISGRPLDEIAKTEIFRPLKLNRTFFDPPSAWLGECAASEFGNEHEKRTCLEAGFDVSAYRWRDYQIRGEVHDGNCHFMGGVSGHAGLFSTAVETFRIAQQFLAEETVLLKPETCALFRTNLTPGLNEARALAFQLAATKDATASPALSKDSFGHLGFTGTSLWIEPETERIFILLTNRTHAHALPFVNINSVRRRFHEIGRGEVES